MKQKAQCLISQTDDPYLNLAIEEYLFDTFRLNEHILFLWRNRESVIIGRNQNPWAECKLEKLKEDGVCLVRRQSGGGAVYQDLGNLIFTFLSDRDKYDKKRNFAIIINALAKFGIKAEQAGRNDLLVDGMKISGSAFKEKNDRAMHHGTLMIDVNLSRLADYLTPSQKKLVSKGTRSVRSRVANLNEFNGSINHDDLMNAIIDEFFKVREAERKVAVVNHVLLAENSKVKEYYEVLKSENWVFGRTPEFTHHLDARFAWGSIDLHLNCDKGVIKNAKIFSDALHIEMIPALEDGLKGVVYSQKAILESIIAVGKKLPEVSEQVEEFGDWISRKI